MNEADGLVNEVKSLGGGQVLVLGRDEGCPRLDGYARAVRSIQHACMPIGWLKREFALVLAGKLKVIVRQVAKQKIRAQNLHNLDQLSRAC